MREYRLIDADCHVVEPPHIWERWLPKPFRSSREPLRRALQQVGKPIKR